MTSDSNVVDEHERCRELMKQLAQKDGKLASPIDLSLKITKPLDLDRLQWFNVDEVPAKMRLTNTGETAIVSAKWGQHRPYLTGGPLDSSYVFSQVHFHWGATEHEGSEHTVHGISYPMELHAAFFKTRYLTQEAALKHEDGMIIVVHLVKLQERSTPGLQWLSDQMCKVTQPQTSTKLDPSSISTLLVPFSRDYLLYWGAMTTQRCSHTMMWLVSRSALAITSDHLSRFRNLLNSQKEPMVKNFREASPTLGRSVFHICPENTDPSNDHVLLPSTADLLGEDMIVGHLKVLELDPSQAAEVFSRGDSSDGVVSGKSELNRKISTDKLKINEHNEKFDKNNTLRSIKSSNVHKITQEGAERDPMTVSVNVKVREKVQKVKMEKKDNAKTRKLLEMQRKGTVSTGAGRSKPSTPQYSGFSAATMKRLQERMKSSRAEGAQDRWKDVCVHPVQTDRSDLETKVSEHKSPQERPPARSKLSVTGGETAAPLRSSLAAYFTPSTPPASPPCRVPPSKIPKATSTTGKKNRTRKNVQTVSK